MSRDAETTAYPVEHQITQAAYGHILTNSNVWSADGRWIVYDVRSDPAGSVFDGSRIERVCAATGEVEILYQSNAGAHCGVVTTNPVDDKVVFILGPENPTPDWSYSPTHRRGVIVSTARPGATAPLDARDIVPPFTAGALRGGSHVHVFDGSGQWVSFTYEDAVLSQFETETADHDINLRGIGVSVPGHPVKVDKSSPRNVDGDYYSVLVTQLHANPIAGTDQIRKASEEGWVGCHGYRRANGTLQSRAIAFQGQIMSRSNQILTEVFIVDLPDDVMIPGDGPLQGTTARRPAPPKGCAQRRLTFTADRKYPGLAGPRHWTHSSPDGSRIAFLMKDDNGIVQIFTVSPNGGPATPVTNNPWSVASVFSWSKDGGRLAYVMDNSVFVTEVSSGKTHRLTRRSSEVDSPRPEACVFSPDGTSIAYVRQVPSQSTRFNQIFVVDSK